MTQDDYYYASVDIATTASGRYAWAEIATFSTTKRSAATEAIKWVESNFKTGNGVALVLRNRKGKIIGSWNYDYEED